MRQLTNDNVVIEINKHELNDLIVYLFDASRWNYEQEFKTLGHDAHQMAMKLWEIKKGLDE